ncbi:MAG: site-2 protease family protein [Solirubrobacteraceae bacterium]
MTESDGQLWSGPVQAPPAPQASVPPPHVPDQAPDWPPQAQQARQSWIKRRFGPLLAAIAAFLAKIKAVLVLIPKVKLFTTVGTMAVSLAAYGWIWGLPFAAGFVLLLFVHEMGHVIALRREGIKASAPMFVPFLGAVVAAKSLGDNATAEARVGLAGPVLGSIGAAVCILIWHATGNDIWRALAYTGFFLNLFNLLPVVPLDGGRAMAAMSPWMWVVGFAALIPLVFVFSNPIMLIILLFAGLETYRRLKQRRSPDAQTLAYYKVRPLDRFLVAAVYLSLIALLVVGMDATNLSRTFNG